MGEEQGDPGKMSSANSTMSDDSDRMGRATHCVRKFAPEGRKKMRRTDNGHITACKISDANPNEMIVSWSGDHIYSFDLIRSPDASEQRSRQSRISIRGGGKGKARESGDRKRKRTKVNSVSQDGVRRSSKPRRAGDENADTNSMALRVRYENGQSEDVTMGDVPSLFQHEIESARESVLTESQKRSLRIAKSFVKIRKLLFSHDSNHPGGGSTDPTPHTASFTSAIGFAASILPEMDDISRTWRYPLNPIQEDIMLQSTLRGNRDSSRRFVQAAGTLARLLGGRLQTASFSPAAALDLFREIEPGPNEGPPQSSWEIFRYDFLKAIILWLEGGKERLLTGFKLSPGQRRNDPRFPVPDDATTAAIDDIIIPYLLTTARDTDSPIPNVDASRFEKNETRHTFNSEVAAVTSFANAISISDDSASREGKSPSPGKEGQKAQALKDQRVALRFWGYKVGRGLLMNAAEGVNFQFVDTAFGGLGRSKVDEGRNQAEIDPNDEEDVIERVTLLKKTSRASKARETSSDGERSVEMENIDTQASVPSVSARTNESDIDFDCAGSDAEVVMMEDSHENTTGGMSDLERPESDDDLGDSEDGDGDEDEDENSQVEGEEDEDGEVTDFPTFMFRSAPGRGKMREKVERDVPCSSHLRQYRGHCNVKTVKDANFFGLQDEYVVSGSDGGHVFIWDRRTSELVNILEGDSEVVNVVQGESTKALGRV